MTSLFELNGLVLIAIFGVMAFAGFIHGMLGLGFPMVATPILATMMDVRSAILITLVPTISVNLISILKGNRSLETAIRFLPIVLFALIGSLIGTSLLAFINPAPFRIALAGLILLYLGSTFVVRIPQAWLLARPILSMALFGLCAGIAAGTTNVMVPS